MKSEWEAGINALESRYFGWWSGSSGCESDGSGGGDSIFFRGTVFVCDRVECWRVRFGLVGRDIFDCQDSLVLG